MSNVNALYYPHTTLENESLLKSSLVLFDKVEWIAPDDEYTPQYENKVLAEAMKIIGDPHIPSEEEKQLVHQEVERLVAQPLPDWFIFPPSNRGYYYKLPYQILPNKFLPKTWELLEEVNFVDRSGELATGYRTGLVRDYQTTPALGLTLMGMLAYVCAGGTKRGITDQGDSYAALSNFFKQSAGFVEPAKTLTEDDVEKYDHLITLSFKTIDCDGLPIEKLIDLRKQELLDNDGVLKQARQKYFKELDTYASRLATEVKFPSDKKTIDDEFTNDMEEHLKELKRELRLSTRKLLLSKEIVATAVLAAGAALVNFLGPLADPLVAPVGFTVLGSLSVVDAALVTGKVLDYRKQREDALKMSPAGWLYMV